MRVRSYLNNDAQGRGKKEEEELEQGEKVRIAVFTWWW